MIRATMMLLLFCLPAWCEDPLNEALDEIIHQGPLLNTLSGDKPITIVTPPPFIDMTDTARRLDVAKREGRLHNSDLGWFVVKTFDKPNQWTEVPGKGRIGYNHEQLVFYSKSALRRLRSDSKILSKLTNSGLTPEDSDAQTISKIQGFLNNTYYCPDGKITPLSHEQHRTVGLLLGYPLRDAENFLSGKGGD